MNTEKIIEKLLKLSKITIQNGATLGEALAAIDMANTISKKYGISIDDIDNDTQNVDDENFVTEDIDTNRHNLHPIDKYAIACITKIFSVKIGIKNKFVFDEKEKEVKEHTVIFLFGHVTDVNIVKTLREIMYDVSEKDFKKFKMEMAKAGKIKIAGMRKKFYNGFVYSIFKKVNSIKENEKNANSDGKSLMVLKDQLINQKWLERNGNFVRRKYTIGIDRSDESFNAGVKSGNSIEI